MSYDSLTFIWYVLLGVLLIGYSILDGFDLGVGILHPFIAKDDRERRLVMNSIGPLWDGNEVWLVTFGGALFAAFPVAYATVFSSFYNAFFLLLTCLIGRAVSLEFRSKVKSTLWIKFWDIGFFLSSLIAAFLLGVAGGNVMAGMELGPKYVYQGGLLSQVYWYPLMVGCLTVSLFALHGGIYLYLKTEHELQARVRHAITPVFYAFASLFILVTLATWWHVPHATENIAAYPILWVVPILNALAVLNIPRAMHLGKPGYAFVTSSLAILAFATLFSVAIYPNFMLSTINADYSVTLDNARSSRATLQTMLIIAAVGLPCVLSYTVAIYWIFRGKVKLDSSSY
ncbi:cytochrome d ubiquinol oxidase subunit II [Thalassoroseus pseudoceratinae]|uniref:cytochrome d ubiquinol oxidase subunit II n=1 Tax=Thalassoroseus pseudoceratinae TaxID=2713176 RepID=UPI0014205A02|nr:cytochrome d ubiquinol oxidase subunit II [Thalassoroseus pseudoceratinae]